MALRPEPEPHRLVLTGGSLVRDGLVDRGHTVVVEGGRIAAVVPAGDGAACGGAEEVDLGGRLITPGLVDLHVHGAAGHGFDVRSTRSPSWACPRTRRWSG